MRRTDGMGRKQALLTRSRLMACTAKIRFNATGDKRTRRLFHGGERRALSCASNKARHGRPLAGHQPTRQGLRASWYWAQTHLSLMLAVVSTVSFLVSGMVLFIVPGAADHRGHPRSTDYGGQNLALAHRLILAGLETQLGLVSSLLLADADEQNLQFILSRTADKSSPFSAVTSSTRTAPWCALPFTAAHR